MGYCFWAIMFMIFLKQVKPDYFISSTDFEFRGAFMTWNFSYIKNTQVDFLIAYDILRNDAYVQGHKDCSGTTNKSQVQRNFEPKLDLVCEKGCIGQIGSLYNSCPNTESQFNSKWPSGLRKLTYTFPDDTKSFVISLQGCCWPTLADHSTGRPFKMRIQGTINDTKCVPKCLRSSLSPPLLDPSSVIAFRIGCPNSYYIPVIDFDDNVFQCLIMENILNLPGIEMNKLSCLMKYSGIDLVKPGYYPILIEIRKFSDSLNINSQPTSVTQIYVMIQMIDNFFKINKSIDECNSMNPLIESPKNLACFTTGSTLTINGTFRIFNGKAPTIKFDFNWWPRGLSLRDLIIDSKDKKIYSFSQLMLWTPLTSNAHISYVTVYVTTSYGQRSQPLTFTVSNTENCQEAEARLGILLWIPPR